MNCLQSLERRMLLSADLGTADSTPRNLIEVNGVVYFSANDGIHGQELWRTDGTQAGTQLLKDIVPGPASPTISAMFAADDKLLFIADNHFWESDGTSDGTVQVGAKQAWTLYSPTIFNNEIFFTGTYDGQTGLFKTNWRDNGTTLVSPMKDFRSGPVVGAGGMIILARDISVQQTGIDRPGYSLFFSDGTSQGTIKSNIVTSYYGQVTFRSTNSTMVMALRPDYGGADLYTTDGTLNGTHLLTSQNAYNLVNAGDKVVYTVNAGMQNDLWVTDGTMAGTHFLKTLTQTSGVSAVGTGNVAFFYQSYTGVLSITRTDGTAGGTTDLDLSGVPIENTSIAAAGGHLYFSTYGVNKLWRTNDDGSGVELVANVELQSVGATDYDGNLMFVSNGQLEGDEPWITDGTADGTHLIRDINTLAQLPAPHIKSGTPSYKQGSTTYFGPSTLRFVGAAPAGATVVLFSGSHEIGRGVADEEGKYLISLSAVPNTSLRVAAVVADDNGDASVPLSPSLTLEVNLDGAGPRLLVNETKSPIEISFDEPLGRAISADDLVLEELGQGIVVDRTHLQLTEVHADHTLYTLTYDDGKLPPGEYRLTAKSGAVTDRVGNELVTAFQHWVVGGTTPPPVTNNNSVVNLSSGALTLSGSSDDDVIVVAKYAGDVSKVLVSVNGVRHIYSRAQISSILVQAGSGDDMVNLDGVSISSKVLAGAGNDTVYGSQAADRISGGDGNDWINAGDGNDTLYGDAGDDKLFGGEGRDYVSGGGGANVLRGGDGVDRILGTRSIDDYRTNRGDIIKLVLV